MLSYDLDIDEGVILKAEGVSTSDYKTVDLILTNKNLIQVNKGILGNNKDFNKYSLLDIRLVNGKANVIAEKGHDGHKQLEVYFVNHHKFYHAGKAVVFNADKWVKAIIGAHKDLMDSLKLAEKESKGVGSLINSFKETIQTARGKVIVKKEPVPKVCKCPKCGAELSGNKGESVECVYCNNIVVIK